VGVERGSAELLSAALPRSDLSTKCARFSHSARHSDCASIRGVSDRGASRRTEAVLTEIQNRIDPTPTLPQN
jgi:hypothetical protein